MYRRYFPLMMAMCMRYTRDNEKALEIINNGFLKVFKKIDTFSFKGSFEGWIRKIVFHCISDYFKKESRYLRFMVFEDADKDFPEQSLSNLYLEDILKLVDKLPEVTAHVFRLHAIEGYTHAEIATRFDISPGTSKWHLSSARKKLKELIKNSSSTQQYAS